MKKRTLVLLLNIIGFASISLGILLLHQTQRTPHPRPVEYGTSKTAQTTTEQMQKIIMETPGRRKEAREGKNKESRTPHPRPVEYGTSSTAQTTTEQMQKIITETPGRRKEARKGVVILTSYRSGSSFFGQLFNQHPNVFYSYEPLVFAGESNVGLQQKLLKSALSCRFHDVSEFVNETDQLSDVFKECLKDNVCFRNKMKSLCSEPLCGVAKSSVCVGCGRIPIDTLRSICLKKSVSVAKIVRLQNIEVLRDIQEDDSLDIKVIHLVRDPRGTSSSRRRLNWGLSMRHTCSLMHRNALLGLQEAKWLKGKYKLVRYEDVARTPFEMAQKIYDFLGLDMATSVLQWIQTDTTGDALASDDKRAKLLKERENEVSLDEKGLQSKILKDAFSTVRVSNATWNEWTKALDLPAILEIQRDCQDAMYLLGYKPIQNNMTISSNSVLLAPINGTF